MTASPAIVVDAPAVQSRAGHEPRHLDFVDALRGVALLAVVVFHVALRCPSLPAWLTVPAGQGVYGVQLFYVVSAFTLFASMAQRSVAEPRPLRSFFLRRLFRIAPMFWVAIVGYMVLRATGLFPTPRPIKAWYVLATACFAHGLHPNTINLIVPGGWSIAVEMPFYLTVPFLFKKITTPARAIVVFIIAAIIGRAASIGLSHLLARYAMGINPSLIGEFTYYWLPAQAPIFCLGFVLFFAIRRNTLGQASSRRALILFSLASIIFLFFTARPTLSYIGFGVGFVFLAWGLSIWPIPPLVNPFTRLVGRISYSAYLLHFAIMEGAFALAGRSTLQSPLLLFALAFTLTLAGTIAASLITFHLVEEPGRKLGKRVIASFQAAATRPS